MPFKWTRIIKIDTENTPFFKSFNVADDTNALKDDIAQLSIKSNKKWAPLFLTDHFLEDY